MQFEESEEESDEDMYGEVRDDDGQDEGEEARIDNTLHAENVSSYTTFLLVVIVIDFHVSSAFSLETLKRT